MDFLSMIFGAISFLGTAVSAYGEIRQGQAAEPTPKPNAGNTSTLWARNAPATAPRA
jgi:hypothetical protein